MKRAFVLVLIMLLSVSIAACGSEAAPAATSSPVPATPATTTEAATVPATEAATVPATEALPVDTTVPTELTDAPEPDTEPPVQKTPWKSIVIKNSSEDYYFSQFEYDPRGEMYTNPIYFYSSATNLIGSNGKMELYTGGKYTKLTCTLVPEAEFTAGKGEGAYFEFYKDNVLCYTSELITYKTIGIDVVLDISGAEYVQIKVINVNPNDPFMAHADVLVCDAFVE